MYSQTIKINIDKELTNLILKRLKFRTLDDFINSKLKEETKKIFS